jgi:hypothetical protein
MEKKKEKIEEAVAVLIIEESSLDFEIGTLWNSLQIRNL